MNNSIFANATFDEGWEIKTTLTLFGNDHEITVCANAYDEEDGITPEQEASCAQFLQNRTEYQKTIETLLSQHFPNLTQAQISERLTPESFVAWDNGNCALLLSDEEAPDDGLAVTLSPEKAVLTQDEYLSEHY